MTRRSYNQAQSDWWKAHPELVALRQLSGIDEAEPPPDESEFSDPEPEDVIDDYAKRRGE